MEIPILPCPAARCLCRKCIMVKVHITKRKYRIIRLGVMQALLVRPLIIIADLYFKLPLLMSVGLDQRPIFLIVNALSIVTVMFSARTFNIVINCLLAEGNDFWKKFQLAFLVYIFVNAQLHVSPSLCLLSGSYEYYYL